MNKGFSLCVLLMVMFVFISGIVNADSDFYSIEVMFDDKNYEIGDEVNFTAHVWNNGVYTHVYNVTAIILNESMGITRQIDFTEITTGIHDGNFTIQSSDIVELDGLGGMPIQGRVVFVLIYAMVGSSDPQPVARTFSIILVPQQPQFIFEISNYNPIPGETVDIDMTIKNETYLDPEHLNMTVYNLTKNVPSFGEEFNFTEGKSLVWSRVSAGEYTASYTIPSDLIISTTYFVSANATFNDANLTNYVPAIQQFMPPIFTVNFYNLYFHNVSQTNTECISELYVTNLTGTPIEGVSLTMFCHIDGVLQPEINNVTDVDGKVILDITYPSDTESVSIYGYANYSGFSQYFGNNTIYNSTKDSIIPSSNGFEVVFHDNNGFFNDYHPGDTVTWNYTAFNNSLSLTNTNITYIIKNYNAAGIFGSWDYELVDYGVVLTDGDGIFSLTFDIPINMNRLDITFRANITGNTLNDSNTAHDDISGRVIDDTMDISIDDFIIGGSVNITVDANVSDDAIAIVIVAPIENYEDEPDWMGPISMGSDSMPSSYMARGIDDKFRIEYFLPDFLPKMDRYGVMVMVVDKVTFNMRYNILEIYTFPKVMNVSSDPSSQEVGDYVNITANVIDDISVSEVYVNIT